MGDKIVKGISHTSFSLLMRECIHVLFMSIKNNRDFPDGTVVGNLPANAGDTGSSPGPGRSHILQSN